MDAKHRYTVSAERQAALAAALVKVQRDADDMAAAFKRWDLGRYEHAIHTQHAARFAAFLSDLAQRVTK